MQNEQAQEIEKLKREEFVLDTEKEQKLINQAEEEALIERGRAKRELLALQMLKQRIT